MPNDERGLEAPDAEAGAPEHAVHGLLAELGRAGVGADERFVRSVLARAASVAGQEAAAPASRAPVALPAGAAGASPASRRAGPPVRWRRWTLSSVAAAAAAIAVAYLALAPSGEAHALLVEARRNVVVIRDGRRLLARPGMRLQIADELVADGFFSAAAFTWGYGAASPTTIRLGQNGRLRLGLGAAGKHLSLEAGQIHVRAEPRAARSSLTITTPHALATIDATDFTLSASGDGTRLDVDRGQVQLRPGSEQAPHTVGPGQYVEVRGGRVEVGSGAPTVTALHLIDADTGRPFARAGLSPLVDGQVVALATLPAQRVTVVADVAGGVGSVLFRVNGTDPKRASGAGGAKGPGTAQVENNPPYTLTGNAPVTPGAPVHYHGWSPADGEHVIEVVPFAGAAGAGAAGTALRLRVVVVR
jgi:hypothetical protein